jgi:hypothetical protein
MKIIWEPGDRATVADDINCGPLAARDVLLEKQMTPGLWQVRSADDWEAPASAIVRETWLKP